jgi:hypothetical protein
MIRAAWLMPRFAIGVGELHEKFSAENFCSGMKSNRVRSLGEHPSKAGCKAQELKLGSSDQGVLS